jgi:hypothetical protein
MCSLFSPMAVAAAAAQHALAMSTETQVTASLQSRGGSYDPTVNVTSLDGVSWLQSLRAKTRA